MKFTLPVLALALTAYATSTTDALATTSVTTHTSTRTVLQVVTETHIGSPPPTSVAVAEINTTSGYAASTGFLPAKNSTAPTGTGYKATASPTEPATFTGAANALRGASVGALAVVGAVAVFVL